MSKFENIEKVEKFKGFLENTSLRQNIINWYDFKNSSNILFLGEDYNCIGTFLLKDERKITLVEKDEIVFNKLKEKYGNYNNINLVNGNLIQLSKSDATKKFDYIVATTSMKRLGEFVNEVNKQKAFLKLLELSQILLKDSGVLLIAVNNKYSIKNFSGARYDEGNSFDIISGKQKEMDVYSKNEIIELIQKSEFMQYKFYYPFPDFKLPSVIYSDEYLPNKNSSKLNYLLYYNPNDTILFNEIEVLKETIKDGNLPLFANSYIIEISKDKRNFNKSKFISFNNFRKKENKMITKMYDEYVIKENIFKEGKKHISNISNYIDILKKCGFYVIDKVENGKVYSKYQSLDNLNDILCEYILEGKEELAYKIIDRWYKYINEKFSYFFKKNEYTVFEEYDLEITDELKEKLNFLDYGFFDIIFENIFVKIDKDCKFEKFLVYDQEWCKRNLPIEFILYRALNNLFYYNPKISKVIDIERLYNKYGIYEYIEIFKKLEQKIQESLIDTEISSMYQSTYSALTTLEALEDTIYYSNKETLDVREQYNSFIKKVESTNAKWQEESDKAYARISELESELAPKNNIVNNIKNLFKK